MKALVRGVKWVIPVRPALIAWVIFWPGQAVWIATGVYTWVTVGVSWSTPLSMIFCFGWFWFSWATMLVLDRAGPQGETIDMQVVLARWWRGFVTVVLLVQGALLMLANINAADWLAIMIATFFTLVILALPMYLVEEERGPGLKEKVQDLLRAPEPMYAV